MKQEQINPWAEHDLKTAYRRQESHTLVYSYQSKKYDGQTAIGSGVLVKLGEHLFLATCAHTLRDAQELPPQLIGPTPIDSESLSRGHGLPNAESPDVAYLELVTGADAVLGKVPCGDWGVADNGVGTTEDYVTVVGVPSERRRENAEQIILDTYGVWGRTIEPSEWSKWSILDGDDEKDIVLEYPGGKHWFSRTGEFVDRIHPGGMSGGGMWLPGSGKIWVPAPSRLIGIQSAWRGSRNYLRGVQILQWLGLIHRDYPDLRRVLEDRFPRVKPEPQEEVVRPVE